jgi:hypothetical protein
MAIVGVYKGEMTVVGFTPQIKVEMTVVEFTQ